MPGMLDDLLANASTFAPSGAPSWLAGAQIPAGMLATNGASPAPEPQGGALPANSTPTQGEQPPVPESSFLGRLANVIGKNSNMLMSMGAGFAGAPSFGQGMSRAFAAGPQGHQEDVRQQAYMGGIGATYQALVQAGAQPHEALAAVYNPDILKQVSKKYFPGVDVSWQGGIPFNATTGQRVAIGNPSIETITDPNNPEAKITAQRNAQGQLEVVNPAKLPGQPVQPSPVAIVALQKGGPSFAGEFDRKYGPGSAARYLQPGQPVQQPQIWNQPQAPLASAVPGVQ
jgi:hypothetical protein